MKHQQINECNCAEEQCLGASGQKQAHLAAEFLIGHLVRIMRSLTRPERVTKVEVLSCAQIQIVP